MLKDALLLVLGAGLAVSGGWIQSYFDTKRRREESLLETKKTIYGKLLGKLMMFDQLDLQEIKEFSTSLNEALIFANTDLEKAIRICLDVKKVTNADFDKVRKEIRKELSLS